MGLNAMYPFQDAAVQKALRAPQQRHILNFETGLGKTRTALEIIKQVEAKNVLIVTPAIVRHHWADEWEDWFDHRGAAPILAGRGRTSGLSRRAQGELATAYASPVQVVSYTLLPEVAATGWDAIVFDEAHRLKNPVSVQSRAARALLGRCPAAVVLALTATLMPDDITDVWNILDLLWPGRFGQYKGGKYVSWAFANRYAQKHEVEVGEKVYTQFKGLNQENAAELEHRLKNVSSRATKKEWRHVLPPFLVSTRKIEGRKYASIDEWLEKQGDDKLTAVKEWIDDAAIEVTHCCILTHLRETAEKIAAQLKSSGYNTVCITGELDPETRSKQIDAAKKSSRAVLVATMHSVGIGIDLTKFTRALFAELYWRPETVIQALGRFWRLSSQEPASVEILCIKDSVDEQMAKNVLTKVTAINTVLPEGDSEARLEEALGALAKMTDEEVLANLMEACQ